MKFRLTFKTPDVLDSVLEDMDYDPETQCDCGGNCVDCDRLMDLARQDQEEVKEFAKQFLIYGEYITIDFDTEAKTATVRKSQ